MSFSHVFNVSVAASWLVLAIVLARPLMKRAPRWALCALWLLVAVRLLMPILPESPVSLIPTAQVIPQEYLAMEPDQADRAHTRLDIVTNPIYPENLDIDLPDSVDRLQWKDLFWTVNWMAGMALMSAYALISYLRLRFHTRVAVEKGEKVWLCDDIDSPFILGLLRPRICLPSGLTEEQQTHIIAHEKAHLQRLDHLWKPLGFALLTVHWFNPVMWLAYWLLCRDIELACDEKVIRDMEKSAVVAYAQTLVSFGTRSFRVGACPLAFGEVGVKERIRAMTRYRKPGKVILALVLVLVLVLAVCFLTNPLQTTLGNLRDPQFAHLFEDASSLLFRNGEYVASVVWPEDFVTALKKTPVTPNEISRSLSEERDRTYELVHGNTALCISRDFSQIWVDDSVKPSYTYGVTDPDYLKNLLKDLIPGISLDDLQGTYVPYQCLYMSNLSSFYPWGGDSGGVYHITSDSFTEERRDSPVTVVDPLAGAWEKIDWESDFFRDFERDSVSGLKGPKLSLFVTGEEPQYRMINGDRFLLWDDGRLMLVDSYPERNGQRLIWSIYRLVPRESMGKAQWTYGTGSAAPYPAFSFQFDLEFSRVEAWSSTGTLIFGGADGEALVYPEEMTMYWVPGEVPEEQNAVIEFIVWQEAEMAYQGTLYITSFDPGPETHSGGQQDKEYQPIIYTAELTGTGLYLGQNLDQSGGILQTME